MWAFSRGTNVAQTLLSVLVMRALKVVLGATLAIAITVGVYD